MADGLGTGGAVVSAADHRLDQAGLIAAQSSSLAVRTGILWGPGSTAIVTGTSATGTMTVNVAAHHWVSQRAVGDGVYIGTKETSTTLNIAVAPGTNSRIDVVYSKQNDAGSTISPDGSTGELYGVVTGTAAASPVKPALPVGAVEIATVKIDAGTTSTAGAGSTISNSGQLTVARGAPIPVRNTTERNALTTYPGLHVIRLDNGGRLERWVTGSTWDPYPLATEGPSSWPVAALRQNVVQSGLVTGWQTITLDAEDIDTAGGHSTSSNTSRWTCPAGQGGTYAIEGGVAFDPMANGLLVNSRILKNGAPLPQSSGAYGAYGSGSGSGAITGRKLVQLAAGEYVELQGYVSSSGWATNVFDGNACWLNLHRIR